ncbi:uncharacterized protein LOC110220143 [Phascolarctos cinereus]
MLPLSHRLLHRARHLSRELCLLLSLAGLAIAGLLSLYKSWIRFYVPVGIPGNFTVIDIYTSLLVPCPETECTLEPDQPPYYLNYSVIFILIASLVSFLLCLALAYSIIFFTGSVPIFDLSTSIASFIAGMIPNSWPFSDPNSQYNLITNSIQTQLVPLYNIFLQFCVTLEKFRPHDMEQEGPGEGDSASPLTLQIGKLRLEKVAQPYLSHTAVFPVLCQGLFLFLCALFYLLQARNFLQEGMSYTLEINYYLTWAGIFLFMMTGFLCFLNYLNFWSIITPGGCWL